MVADDRTRVLRGLLFQIEPLDPVSLFGAVAILVAAALVRTYLPPGVRRVWILPRFFARSSSGGHSYISLTD